MVLLAPVSFYLRVGGYLSAHNARDVMGGQPCEKVTIGLVLQSL
jgi:hypothetical protein